MLNEYLGDRVLENLRHPNKAGRITRLYAE